MKQITCTFASISILTKQPLKNNYSLNTMIEKTWNNRYGTINIETDSKALHRSNWLLMLTKG